MEQAEIDPLLSSYVLEELPDAPYRLTEAAALAARASALFTLSQLENPSDVFSSWLSSGYRKHLRRAKTKDFEKLIAEEQGIVEQGAQGRLYVSPIHLKSETPKLISRLQLSGFKCRDESEPYREDSPVTISLNEALGMSFGKAVIASAHAAQQLALTLMTEEPEALNSWSLADYRVNASFGAPEPSSERYARIEDHGLTEVPAGSITAVASFS